MTVDKKLLEQVVKAVVSFNGQKVEFDKKFLELIDKDVELKVERLKDSIVLKTQIRRSV